LITNVFLDLFDQNIQSDRLGFPKSQQPTSMLLRRSVSKRMRR